MTMDGLGADEARLTLRVLGALFDGLRDGLLEFFVGVVWFGAAPFFYLLAELVMATLFPVLRLAGYPQ